MFRGRFARGGSRPPDVDGDRLARHRTHLHAGEFEEVAAMLYRFPGDQVWPAAGLQDLWRQE